MSIIDLLKLAATGFVNPVVLGFLAIVVAVYILKPYLQDKLDEMFN